MSPPWLLLAVAAALAALPQEATPISIRPADFDRYIMPCYLGGSFSQQAPQTPNQQQQYNSPASGYPSNQQQNSYYQNDRSVAIGSSADQQQQQQMMAPYGGGGSNYSMAAASTGSRSRDVDRFANNLGQQMPRANSMDNFVALVSKIESANPRLANNPDQLVRMLLGRFRMDNYYYDVRNRVPIAGEQDPRTRDIIPALFGGPASSSGGGAFSGGGGGVQFALGSDLFPEQLLDHDEKCSMYFMLSHFIDKQMTNLQQQPLGSSQPSQLAGGLDRPPLRPPSLQAAGSGYPASASAGFGASGSGGPARYPGPSAGFGSQATNGMYSFGSGLSNQPSDYNAVGGNPLGQNTLRENPVYTAQQISAQQSNYNSPMRQTGPYSGAQQQQFQPGASRYNVPYIDGQAARSRVEGERQAIEYGVVTVANQENAALVLNRVLMGVLAATTPPQTIRQLASTMYPLLQPAITAKIDEDIDPLYGVTLADLWAISSIPKSGSVFDFRLGDNGHWNDTMCPTTFVLERAKSIRFTTAELIGGLDGFALGMFRRRMIAMRKNIRLSELLRMYYSKAGFRPQFAEVSVCNRASALTSQMDDLRRQTENYLRLYQLNLPTTDDQISTSINRLEAFRDMIRQVSQQYAPQEICADSSLYGNAGDDGFSSGGRPGQEQCEIAKADVVTVLDTSMQANEQFMNLVVNRLAQKLGLSRQGNTFSVLTNQQDTTGYAGAYSFNAIVRNSSNTAEIGCALVQDASRSYQGGQISDPTRLMEMFERALINLDTEYLTRQMQMGSGPLSLVSSSDRRSSYVSSLFGSGGQMDYQMLGGNGPKNTGGAKVIVWFNYGSQPRVQSPSSGQTNWYPGQRDNNGYSGGSEQNQYKLSEAKKYLRENFRGASILAVSSSKEDAKAFVFDESRDIFTDIPQGGGSSGGDSYYQAMDASSMASLVGPADQLVARLLTRMCDIPAVFQYPMCFRVPSENVAATGYITPGKKQYWMMSPKTFFASRSVRMAFRVEGGRLRVCFGRMVKPDESATRSDTQYQGSGGSILFGGGGNGPPPSGGAQGNQIVSGQSSSGSNYYTGLSNGICKDVSPGQEIDFVVDDPCYKKSIAECEPFYFVVKEISNPGEGDPNYMCKDEGCKRFDQVKFVMTHTGVVCSSALRTLATNWLVILLTLVTTFKLSNVNGAITTGSAKLITIVTVVLGLALQQVKAQQAGVYDFGEGRHGERRGNFSPSEVLAIILLVMTVLAGLALTIGLCYYVTKRNSRGMTRVEQNDF